MWYYVKGMSLFGLGVAHILPNLYHNILIQSKKCKTVNILVGQPTWLINQKKLTNNNELKFTVKSLLKNIRFKLKFIILTILKYMGKASKRNKNG